MQQFFKLTIEYDGTNYHGWQVQPNGITVQETIETALERITGQKLRIHSSGRTDAGVHALGQCAHFACNTNLTPEIMQKALNALLPPDIVIKDSIGVDEHFHARFSAKSKRYRYTIYNHKLPGAIGRQYALHIQKELNMATMAQAAGYLIGEHDFKGFECVGTLHSTTIRHVTEAVFIPDLPYLYFEIEANGFLRYMVRSIVGTLLEIGLGKRSPEDIKAILSSGERKLAGVTAPPHGLALLYVNY